MTYCKANSCYNSTNYSWNDYCSYHERCLSKLREHYSGIGDIREIETFETWFNGNCGYVIEYDYSCSPEYPYYIWIVVYEPKKREMKENLSTWTYHTHYGSLSGARDKAKDLKNKLQSGNLHDTPMLEVHHKVKNWERFSNLITSPWVIEENLPCYYYRSLPWQVSSRVPASAEQYLKPLDIVWVKRSSEKWEVGYYHVGVYIGKWDGENWMCHLDGDERGAEVVTWKSFLENGTCEDLIKFHPIIPFKNYRKIAKQIAWATDGTPYRQGNYDLHNRNCEHFANMIVYGINYSKQIYDNHDAIMAKEGAKTGAAVVFAPLTFGFSLLAAEGPPTLNNDKDSTIKLTNEMNESNDKLGWITNYRSQEIERQFLQEVPPKQNCRIM